MKLYEVLASEYTEIFPSSREKADFVESYLEQDRTQQILDIGCASGEFAFQLASSRRIITGIDLDSFMIREAELSMPSGCGGEIQFLQADMKEFLVQSKPASFDLIICLGNTIVYLDGGKELQYYLQSALNALKPQGTMIIQILNYGNPRIGPGFKFPPRKVSGFSLCGSTGNPILQICWISERVLKTKHGRNPNVLSPALSVSKQQN